MKTIAICIITILCLCSMALAVPTFDEQMAQIGTEVQGKELPSPAGKFFANGNINLYVGEKVFGLEIKDKNINSFTAVKLADPAFEVFTDETTLNQVMSDPTKLKAALKDGTIKVVAYGFGNKLKLKIGMWFLDSMVEEVSPLTPPPELKVVIAGKTTEKTEDKTSETKNTTETTTQPAITEPITHIIKIEKEGYNPKNLEIKAGESVTWKVTRSGNLHQAMVLGAQNCIDIKSKILVTGEEFTFTFDTPRKCNIVDGITTTQTSIITIK